MMPDASGVHGALAHLQGWLGARDNLIHSGEGPISRVRWAGSLVAWANNLGVKVGLPLELRLATAETKVQRPRAQVLVMCRCMMLQSIAGLALWSGPNPGDLQGLLPSTSLP